MTWLLLLVPAALALKIWADVRAYEHYKRTGTTPPRRRA